MTSSNSSRAARSNCLSPGGKSRLLERSRRDPFSEEPNAVKFETFVFDALLAKNPLILEADRLETFPRSRTGRGSFLESSQADQIKRGQALAPQLGWAYRQRKTLSGNLPPDIPSERLFFEANLKSTISKRIRFYLG